MREMSQPLDRNQQIRLMPNEVIRLERTSYARAVTVKRGIVWLTGNPADRDVLLRTGERYEFQNRWPYILQALEYAELHLAYG